MPIYTKRGDKGKTDLHSGERVQKSSTRIEAVGTLDELNALVGKAASFADDDELREYLESVQNDLHICQTDLANTEDEDHPRMLAERTEWLEEVINRLESELPDLQDFLLQGGTQAAAETFHARTVCRRAERQIVNLASEEEINPEIVKYINRLSDFLFVIARTENYRNDVEERHPSY